MANIQFLNNAYFADKVGIGPNRTSPAVPLDVEGKIRSNDDTSGDYLEMFNDGSVSGQSFITTTNNELVLVPQNGVLRLQGGTIGSGNNASMEIYDALNTAVKVKLNSSGDSYLNGGNVGIGTTSPAQELHVDGNTLISAEKYYYTAGTGAGFGSDASGNFKIRQNDADLIFGSGNNVGIGTTSPASKLEVSSGSGANGDCILTISADTDNTSSASSPKLLMSHKGGTKTSSFEIDVNDRMRMENDAGFYFVGGNVGIGTSAPAAELEVQGDIQLGSYLYFNNNDSRPKSIDGSGGGFSFRTASTDRLKIAFNGNVGIGTTAQQKLDVAGNIRVANGTAAYFGSDGTGGFIQTFNTQTFRFLGTTGNETVRVNNANGKVGIGTTNPEGKLHIADSVDNTTGLKFTTTSGGNNDEVNMHFQGSNPFSPFYISRKQTGGAEIQLQQDGDIILNGSNGDNVGIGTTNPVFNSILEISSTTKGVLLPRLTTTQVNAIASPGNGLTVYNTTLNTLCFYNGSSWQKVSHTNM